MDNDKKIVKRIKSVIKALRFKLHYFGRNVLSDDAGNNYIKRLVQGNNPFAVLRLGATETRCAWPWLTGGIPTEEVLQRGLYLSGIFPPDPEHNAEFSRIYLESLREADALALCEVYKEKPIVDRFCGPSIHFLRIRSLEPYYFANPWSEALKEKKVLIVHPFIESIKKQYERRERLFANKDVLPTFKALDFVQAVQSAAGGGGI